MHSERDQEDRDCRKGGIERRNWENSEVFTISRKYLSRGSIYTWQRSKLKSTKQDEV